MISKTEMRGGEYKSRDLKMHLELRDQQLKTIIYIYTPHGNHKPTIYYRYTHSHTHTHTHTHTRGKRKREKRKRNPNITLKIVIKSQEKRQKIKKFLKTPTKTTHKQLTKWQSEHTYQ